MKTITTFSFFILIAIQLCFGQNTRALFSNPGQKYGIVYLDSYANYKKLNKSSFYDRDTTINNLQLIQYTDYRSPLRQHYLYIEGVKVFYYFQYKNSLSLIYDFGLIVNDTFENNYYSKLVVRSRDTVTFSDGKPRTHIKLQSLYSKKIVEWIEGIGDINLGPFFCAYIHPYDLRFVCLHENQNLLFSVQDTIPCSLDLFCKLSIPRFTYTSDGEKLMLFNNSINDQSLVWDFGDGETSTEENPFHIYNAPGCQNVTLKTISECGDTSSTSYNINYCIKGEWERNFKVNTTENLKKFRYIDDQKLYFFTSDALYYSDDRGLTFRDITSNIEPFRRIDYAWFNGTNGIVVGNTSSNVCSLFSTMDGGNTWENPISVNCSFTSLSYDPSQNKFLVIFYVHNDNQIFISEDFGFSWEKLVHPTFKNYPSSTFLDATTILIHHLDFIDSTTYYYYSVSLDRGKNWETYSIPRYYQYYFLNQNTGYFLLSDNSLVLTHDLLKTYTEIYKFPSYHSIDKIKFTGPKIGFIDSGSKTLYTKDGGKSWLSTCEGHDFQMMGIDYNNLIFAVDNDSQIWSFTYPTINEQCSFSSTEDDSNEYFNLKIVPNPVQHGSKLQLFPKRTDQIYQIDIFDSIGRHILSKDLINGELNIPDLPPGYFIASIHPYSGEWVKKLPFIIL